MSNLAAEPAPDSPTTLAALLRALREQALLTQEQLAERAGLSVGTVQGLEAGRIHRPRSGSVRLLAEALELSAPQRELLIAAARGEVSLPSKASSITPCQLPMDLTDFTGRATQMQVLQDLLQGSQQGNGYLTTVVISTIDGTAGVGKTALAMHWAHRVKDHFRDGQLVVNLHGYAPGPPVSPLQALAQLLQGLGLEPEQVPVDVEAAAGLYRSLLAGRRVLVLLDNARDAEQVRPLLPGSPGSLVVVTSRDRLTGLVASHGAKRLTLDVLTPTEALALLTRILGPERIAFEPDAAGRLAAACGQLPLALRIAAATLASHDDWPISGYVARLRQGDQLAELAVDGDPHAAVATAFDHSYTVLHPETQRLFRLLGLVPGPEFTVPAAAVLAALPIAQTERLLDRLASVHLVEPRAPGRYGLHDLLRIYARRRAEQEDDNSQRRAATERLLAWYLHTADAADRLLYPQMQRLPIPKAATAPTTVGLDEPVGALAWLDAERANLVASVRQAADHGPRPLAWLLADTLRGYFWHHRHMVDWLAVAHAALTAAQGADEPQAQAVAHRNLGTACQCLGDHTKAAEHHTSALALARQAGWLPGEAAVLSNLGMLYSQRGQLQRAVHHYAQGLALYRQTGSKGGQAITLANLGHVIRELGRPEQAVEHLTTSLALHHEIGSQGGGQTTVLETLGETYSDLGRLEDAREVLTQALIVSRSVGDRYSEACELYALARVQRDAGQLTHALELAQAAVALAREIRDPRVHADTLNTLGSIHLRLGYLEQATEHHRQALDLAGQTDTRYPQIEGLLGLAAAHQHHGQHGQAFQHAQQALTLAHQSSYQILLAQAHSSLAAIHLDLERHDEAIRHAQEALDIHRRTGHRLGQARTLVVLGRALQSTHGPAAATACWQEALALFIGIGTTEADYTRALLDGSVQH